jgi:hypothetical protein
MTGPQSGEDKGRQVSDTQPIEQRPAPPNAPEHDRSGRELAVRLPEWDLVPPTEFLDRTGR